jgi:thiol-disulfide isomerase/thioredoxin
MNRSAGLLLFALLGVVGLSNLRWVRNNWERFRRGGARAGQLAPEFRLPLLSGGETALADARGHTLVLSFWATWCGPCLGELPGVERLYQKLSVGEAGVRFLAVNVDNRAARSRGDAGLVSDVAHRLGLSLPIALDDGSAGNAYQVTSIPETVIVDGSGTVKTVLFGVYPESEVERLIRAAAR